MAPTDKKYRFRPKCYGRGFVPISWEGWLFTGLLLAVTLGAAYYHGMLSGGATAPTRHQVVGFLVDIYLIVFASLWYMDSKTDGKLHWRRENEH